MRATARRGLRKTGSIISRSPNNGKRSPTVIQTPAWKPQPWQVAPFNDKDSDVILLSGSMGGGKSSLFQAKAHHYAMAYPRSFVLVIRKTRDSITSSVAEQLELNIIGDSAKHNKSKSAFIYPNGSQIKYAGMQDEKARKRLRSIGLEGGVDLICVEEACELTEDDFHELVGRLRGRRGGFRQIILATNPDSPHHFIYKMFIEDSEVVTNTYSPKHVVCKKPIEGGVATTYYSSVEDNAYADDSYRRRLESMPGIMYERNVLGKWVSAEGLVHSNFDAKTNIIESESEKFIFSAQNDPDNWYLIGSIDFGFEHPSVVQWWAVDRTEPEQSKMYLYREIYQTRTLIADLGEQILSLSSKFEQENIRWYVDHAAQERAILENMGINTVKANKSVARGLSVVNNMLRGRMFLLSNSLVAEDSRLKKNHLPVRTSEEFTLYTWDKDATGVLVDKPVKKFDHGMDATRYAAVAVDAHRRWIMV